MAPSSLPSLHPAPRCLGAELHEVLTLGEGCRPLTRKALCLDGAWGSDGKRSMFFPTVLHVCLPSRMPLPLLQGRKVAGGTDFGHFWSSEQRPFNIPQSCHPFFLNIRFQ